MHPLIMRNTYRALPALTIHTAVARAKQAFAARPSLSPRVRAWGPTFTGLAIVPVLPYLYDHPVEWATERAGEWVREWVVRRGLGDMGGGTRKGDGEL
jgi:fission process protein 1